MRPLVSRLFNILSSTLLVISAIIVPLAPLAIHAATTPAPFTATVIEANQGPWGKNLGDLNGDGQLDAIEGGGDLGTNVYWYDYPSWTKHQIGTLGGDDDLQVADINGDGATDVIVNGGLSWYANPRGTGGNVTGLWTRHIVDAASNTHDLLVGDVNGDGKPDMVVRGTGEIGPTTLYLQGSTSDTWTKVAMPNAPDGQATAIADINRDGKTDIVANGYWLQQPANPVTGDWARRDFAAWSAGASVNVADINRDGRVDVFLAPSEAGTGSLAWFENPVNPLTDTWVRHDISSGITDVHRFHLVDMNKDGNLDLVFAEMHQSPLGRVGVFYSENSGSTWTLQTLATTGSHNIAVGDVDADGDTDILGANWSISASADHGALTLWRNTTGVGLSLSNWTYLPVDTAKTDQSFGLNFANLTGSGLQDIVAGRYWYKNPGGAMTTAWTRTDLGAGRDAMLATDVDGDGQQDIIAQAIEGGSINVYWLRPTSSSATSFTSTLVGTLPYGSRDYTSQGYAVAQLNAGGKPQIVFSNDFGYYYFSIPANPAAGNWPRVQINSDGTQEGLAAADINRDGRTDVVGSSHTSSGADGKEVDWWTNPGNGSAGWTKHIIGTTTNEVSRVRISDVNNDGLSDIVAADDDLTNSRGNVYWFEQTAAGTWLTHTIASNLGSLESMDVGDFNHDGKTDVVTGDHRGNGLQTIIWENTANGASWISHVIATGKESHLGTRVVDLEGDGDLDIVSIAYDAYQTMYVWRNDATAGANTPDTTPPILSNLTAASVASSSATITWTTNEAANGQVEYGPTSAPYASASPLSTTLSGNHSIALTGLTPDTTYHYQALSQDSAGNAASSADLTFTTLAAGAVAHLQTANNSSNVGGGSISQSFTAANTAGSLLVAAASWGDGSALSCSDTLGNTYAVATTQYDTTNQQSLGICYAANAKAGSNNTVTASFSSGTAGYRRLLLHEYAGIAATSPVDVTSLANAVATTATNAVTSGAKATTASGDLIFGAVMDDAGTAAIIGGTGFTQRGNLAQDFATQDLVQAAAGSVASTQTFDATHRYLAQMVAFKHAQPSMPDTTAPVISNVTSSGITTAAAAINWATNEAADAQVQYGLTASYGSSTVVDPALATAHSVNLAGLTPDTVYHYRVVSKDASGNAATSGDMTVTTLPTPPADTTAPIISNVTSSGISSSAATISWTTNEAADTQVQYGPTTSYGSSTSLNPTLATTHSVTLAGLTPATTYHYRVLSKDASSNLATSGDFTFTTPAMPAISLVQTASSTNNANAKTITQAFTTANTAGNLIAVAVSWGSTSSIACSDSQGNTYAVATTQYDATNQQALGICYATNIKAGANTVTVTFSANGDYRRILVHEYRGLAITSPVDVTAKNIAAGTTTANGVTSTAATTTAAGDLIFGAVMDDGGTTAITAGAGFTQRASLNGKDIATQDTIQTAAGSIASTQTFSVAHRYLAQMVAFKAR